MILSYEANLGRMEFSEGTGAIGEVVASDDPRLKRGDLVSTIFGWRELFNAPAANLQKLETFGLPPQAFLGVAGMPGLTAWVGLLKIAALKPGDVVFVSAAAGAVGSVVCQIAKIKGNTVIGSAGGADKGAFLREIGVDHVIDYKAPAIWPRPCCGRPPRARCVLRQCRGRALGGGANRGQPVCPISLCGMISQYNVAGMPPGRAISCWPSARASGSKASLSRTTSTCCPSSKGHVRVDTRRQTDVEGNRRAWHRECADGLSQAVHGREFGKDAGEAEDEAKGPDSGGGGGPARIRIQVVVLRDGCQGSEPMSVSWLGTTEAMRVCEVMSAIGTKRTSVIVPR